MKIRKAKYGDKIVEYDADNPCIICGEPVIGASVGGTFICGSCDLGKCRYCGINIFVFKEKFDGGKSKQALLKHMEWHHAHTSELVKDANDSMSRFLDKLEIEL